MTLNYKFPFKNLSNINFKQLFSSNSIIDAKNYSQNNLNYIYPSKAKLKSKNNNALSILVLNIRSLNKNFPKLQILVNKLKVKPSVIIVSETWITENKPFLFTLKNYIFLNKPSETKAGGAGIFLDKNLNYTILNNLNFNIIGCEDLWIKINFSKNKVLFFLQFTNIQFMI